MTNHRPPTRKEMKRKLPVYGSKPADELARVVAGGCGNALVAAHDVGVVAGVDGDVTRGRRAERGVRPEIGVSQRVFDGANRRLVLLDSPCNDFLTVEDMNRF